MEDVFFLNNVIGEIHVRISADTCEGENQAELGGGRIGGNGRA